MIFPEKSFRVQGISATTLLPCSNFALLASAMTLYSPGASFVVPMVVGAVSFTVVVIESPASFLAHTEALVAVSAIIARKSGNERRDISDFFSLLISIELGPLRSIDRNLKNLKNNRCRSRRSPQRASYSFGCEPGKQGY